MMKTTIVALVIGLMSLLVAPPLQAAAPECGTVAEGQSVPGVVALGFTRPEVEATWTLPDDSTQNVSTTSGYGGLAFFEVM
jgi:hypothetical protein